jgi:hypothetical protein
MVEAQTAEAADAACAALAGAVARSLGSVDPQAVP